MYLCPSAPDPLAAPICLKAHAFGGHCTACGRTRLHLVPASMPRPSLIADRTECVRDQVRTEAGRLAAVLSEDSRIVLQLRAQADELAEIARLQRAG